MDWDQRHGRHGRPEAELRLVTQVLLCLNIVEELAKAG